MATVRATTARVHTSTLSSTLEQGSTGPAVKELQTLLKRQGHHAGDADGKFGAQTDAAVRKFQHAQGLKVDGQAGVKTMTKLRAGGATPGGLQLGASGAGVKELQQLLQSTGHYRGNIGGTFGAQTAAALRSFQQRAGLAATGSADATTMTALRNEARAVAPSAPTAPGRGVQAVFDFGKSVLGSKYAAVNPYRFGEVKWDGNKHQSENGSGKWYQFPRGTRVFDCSGFVVAAFKNAGVNLAAKGLTTSSAVRDNTKGFLTNITREQLQPGDLITYKAGTNGVGHIVIYMGDGKTMEAASSKGVSYGKVDWARANSFRRVPLPS